MKSKYACGLVILQKINWKIYINKSVPINKVIIFDWSLSYFIVGDYIDHTE